MRIKSVAVTFLILVISGCKLVSPVETQMYIYEPVYIESLEVPDSIMVNTSFLIKITGYFEDASWYMHHIDMVVDNMELEIYPVAQQNDTEEVFARVMVAFERNLTYNPAQTGSLSIKVIGHNQTLSGLVQVLPETCFSLRLMEEKK